MDEGLAIHRLFVREGWMQLEVKKVLFQLVELGCELAPQDYQRVEVEVPAEADSAAVADLLRQAEAGGLLQLE